MTVWFTRDRHFDYANIYPVRRPAIRQSRKDDRGPDSPVERAASGGLCLSEADEGEGIFGALHGQS